jgi:DNA sulfur modification protein DndD
MAAIGDIMPIRVPIIMDTPLGRLDRDHRERLLTFFAHRDVQTIMLSQPDEVNGIYLEMIEDRVATRFLLDHQGSSKGLGATVAREGYFNEAAA